MIYRILMMCADAGGSPPVGSGSNVYVTNLGSSTSFIFNRNTSTGALSGTSTIAVAGSYGIAVYP
jgi:hypothetical protein